LTSLSSFQFVFLFTAPSLGSPYFSDFLQYLGRACTAAARPTILHLDANFIAKTPLNFCVSISNSHGQFSFAES
jgi:hypothetical protein